MTRTYVNKENSNNLTYSDYEKLKYQNKLFFKNKEENIRLIHQKKNKELFNLSLRDISKNFSNTFINMLNDLVIIIDKYFIKKTNKSNDSLINDIFLIFIIEERLIYSGIFFILLGMFFYFMDISS